MITCNKNSSDYQNEWNKRNKNSYKDTLAILEDYVMSGKPDEALDKQRKQFFTQEGFYLLLFKDTSIAGMAGFKKINTETGVLKSVYVKPQYRGKGYGELLINKIISLIKVKNYKTLILETAPFFESAIKVYYKLGFSTINYFPEESFPKDWSEKMNLIYMKLQI